MGAGLAALNPQNVLFLLSVLNFFGHLGFFGL